MLPVLETLRLVLRPFGKEDAAAVGIDYAALCQRILDASLEARRAGR